MAHTSGALFGQQMKTGTYHETLAKSNDADQHQPHHDQFDGRYDAPPWYFPYDPTCQPMAFVDQILPQSHSSPSTCAWSTVPPCLRRNNPYYHQSPSPWGLSNHPQIQLQPVNQIRPPPSWPYPNVPETSSNQSRKTDCATGQHCPCQSRVDPPTQPLK